MSAHVVQWVTASPLWPDTLAIDENGSRETTMQKPALLRFERDSFMADLAKQLETDPTSLKDNVATPITYRLPSPGETEPPAPTELKLYQAVHGHFYLVAATLACRLPGLPEHQVATAVKETVRFVVRRLDDTDPNAEWAWVDDPTAAKGKSWLAIDASETGAVAENEDLLPLFPVRYPTGGLTRTLFVGLVPTASADAFRAAGPAAPDSPLHGSTTGPGSVTGDQRAAALTPKVANPLHGLFHTQTAAPADAPASKKTAIEQEMKDQQIEASRFLLLDFAEFLHDNLGWFASDTWTGPTDTKGLTLWGQLAAPAVTGGPTAGPTSWRTALAAAWADRLKLSGDDPGALTVAELNLRLPGLQPDTIDTLVAAALPPLTPPDLTTNAVSIQGDVAEPPIMPKIDARGSSRYVIRCVYQRPECGALCPDVVSARSDKFKIASFFDLDAPSRSIVISMPVDTSLKDLRKLRKNVSFLLSNELRQQMNRVTGLQDALDGSFTDGGGLQLGMICSFSIPIITICALIVLMIFINLLNIVFWWMPFLKICFPIPVKAK